MGSVAQRETPVGVLVRFSRLISGTADPASIMPLLADAAVEHVAADAAAVLRVTDDEHAHIVAGRNLPAALDGFRVEIEALGTELGPLLIAGSGGRFQGATILPLVAGGDLYGALALLSATPALLDPERLELAAALADLAATSFARAEQYRQLERSYAELRASREALARTEKLGALGQMAAGVAHDLKNILNPLGLQLRLLERRLERDPLAARQVVRDMDAALRTGVEIIGRLNTFSRQEPEHESERVDLNDAVGDALGLARPRVAGRPGVSLVAELGSPPPVRARTSELVSALVNLILNAVDAIGDAGGSITVRTGAGDGGGWVEVSDTGPGMPPEVERRVFEPFFTTKKDGTGLGLSMVYAFVRRQSGRTTLTTAPGQGARFRLWFPVMS
jgi:signal transduction histidine kinase